MIHEIKLKRSLIHLTCQIEKYTYNHQLKIVINLFYHKTSYLVLLTNIVSDVGLVHTLIESSPMKIDGNIKRKWIWIDFHYIKEKGVSLLKQIACR